MKRVYILLLMLTLLIPSNVLAFSTHVIPGGENVGIEVRSNGIMIVGLYDIGGNSPGRKAGLEIGDIITDINDITVASIDDMVNEINNNTGGEIRVKYNRKFNTETTNLTLVKDTNGYKTGLFVKDSINGLGTLTFIDPSNNSFGVLGHEIIEKNSGRKVDISGGKIFASDVTHIEKSRRGTPGGKNARFDQNNVFGEIKSNTTRGIYGKYVDELPDKDLIEVGKPNDLKLGPAKALTVLKDKKIESFDIRIIAINQDLDQKTKNFVFEIVDEELLKQTGGVVQGMSGSPIIQNEKLVGAITHVVVDDPKQGYGIFITNMLEEVERD